ncbi:uncharacterized protein LOC129595891 [Paramacrobiotus metropolitanus]|uniref:uncharacterized protein LOC129595891 n=1 Tax=Paramacrobiotus metropolitanus TaxID=2943436 RepID=UPI002445C956|nr:uncharacterized protein LOC129595891 [Paramacrobiotus metropolitanus]
MGLFKMSPFLYFFAVLIVAVQCTDTAATADLSSQDLSANYQKGCMLVCTMYPTSVKCFRCKNRIPMRFGKRSGLLEEHAPRLLSPMFMWEIRDPDTDEKALLFTFANAGQRSSPAAAMNAGQR